MAEVFISYARTAEAQAETVEQALTQLGYSVWRDSALPVHRGYADVIEERIDKAAAVLVLWSRDAARSEWVRSEANRGRETGKLVQASLDRTLPPMPFDQLHCADLQDWRGQDDKAWRKVLDSLESLAGAAPKAALLVSNHSLPKPKSRGEPLLAVLAFDNLSGDADFLYFSDGISDEILHTVSRTTKLKVVARSSSFQLRGAEKSASRVAQELGATHLLDGSVRRSGDRVRITAQLVESATQTTLWSDRFDRDLSDVFALQDEIAEAVAQALKSTFAPRETGAVDPAAYDLYLRARVLDSGRFGWDLHLLDEVVARAPDFLPGWEALATTLAVNARYGDEHTRFGDLTARMEAALERVVAFSPGSALPGLTRALVAPHCGAFLESERAVARALAERPADPFVLIHASSQALGVGRARVALAYAAQAYELDRLDPITAGLYAELLAINRHRREAFEVFDEAVPRWPDNGFVRIAAMGKAIEAEDWTRLDRYGSTPGELGIYEAWRLALVSAGADLKSWTAELTARTLETERAVLAAAGTLILSSLGHLCRFGAAEAVFDLIDQASFSHLFVPGARLLPGDVAISQIFYSSAAPLRADHRFPRLCAKLGLCDYWVAADRWPDCADEVAYDFRAEARALASPGGEPPA